MSTSGASSSVGRPTYTTVVGRSARSRATESRTLARSAAHAAGSAVVGEAYRAIGLHQAMYVIPALSAALAMALYAGSRTIATDMARRDEPGPRAVVQSAQ